MTCDRLLDYLDQMERAARDALEFVEGLPKDEFLADKRTQQAVTMSLMIIGEAATKVASRYPIFVEQHSEIPWDSMRGIRNRIAHGYFDINLDTVWDTVRVALPALLESLPSVRHAAGDRSSAD